MTEQNKSNKTENSYLNKITLEYLLNPCLYERINQRNNGIENDIMKEIQFYRKRINHLTKEMSRGEYINDNFKKLFINYSSALIYYFKQIDEKDILQEEYDNLDNSNTNTNRNKNSDGDDNQNNANNLLIKKKEEVHNLDNFVRKVNVNMNPKILPKQRNANIKNPDLKKKGI